MSKLAQNNLNYFKPLSLLTVGWLVIVLFFSIYTCVRSLENYNLGIAVVYQDNYIEITEMQKEFSLQGGFLKGDRIIMVDTIPWEISIKPYLVEENRYKWDLLGSKRSLAPGTSYILSSTKGRNLTIERNGTLLTLDLTKILNNPQFLLILYLQGFASLIFWSTSVLLFILQPNRSITFYFAVNFNLLGLYFFTQITNSRFTDIYLSIIPKVFSCFLPVSSLYLACLFPYGRWRSRLTKTFCNLALLFASGLFSLSMWVGTDPNFDSEQMGNFISELRSLFLVGGVAITQILYFVYYRQSIGLERVKIRLYVMTLLIVTSLLLFLYVCNTFLYILTEFLVYYGNLFCLSAAGLPVVTLYAIVRHRLYFFTIFIRQSAVYVLLTLILSILYVCLKGVVSLLFSTYYSSFSWNFLIFLILALSINKLKYYSQKIVDRIFYREELDYPALLKKWTAYFTQNTPQLDKLIDNSLKALANDFAYDEVAILIVEKEGFGNSEKTSPSTDHQPYTPAEQTYWLTIISSKDLSQVLLPTNPETFKTKSFLAMLLASTQLNQRYYNYCLQNGLPDWLKCHEEIIEPFCINILNSAVSQAESGSYQCLVPFSKQNNLRGGLLFGQKLSGQLLTPKERDSLVIISQNLSNALNTALRLQEEQALRQMVQDLFISQEKLRIQEQRKMALELHDGLKQQISFMDSCLSSWLLEEEQIQQDAELTRQLIIDLHKLNKEMLNNIKQLITTFNPQILPGGLVNNLRQMLIPKATRYPEKIILFKHYLDKQRDLLSYFNDEENLFIYRLVQEAVTNTLTHSEANFLQVTLSIVNDIQIEENIFKGAHLVVEIKDNGKGFDTSSTNLNRLVLEKHFGLFHMQERTRYLGGQFYLKSSSNGTVIHAIIPIPQNPSPSLSSSSLEDFLVDQILEACSQNINSFKEGDNQNVEPQYNTNK
jgi:signal transduction histidine kinase